MIKEVLYDMSWGNPYFLLDILSKQYIQRMHYHDIANMSYAPDEGFADLVNLTKEAIAISTGLKYNYVIITAGATQALNSILKLEKSIGKETVLMNQYGYPYYTDMVKNIGLRRAPINTHTIGNHAFVILDSPSNPLGIQGMEYEDEHKDLYWDAVYHNNIYNAMMFKIPKHKAMVGSYSKLLGITGARIGWIATNDVMFYKLIRNVSVKDTATVSVPSQKMVIDILQHIDLEKFIHMGQFSLNSNRGEFQRIEKFFDGQPVPKIGMFYCAKSNPQAQRLLEKCGIHYVKLDDDMIRLSMGQSNMLTYKAIQHVLKEDRL